MEWTSCKLSTNQHLEMFPPNKMAIRILRAQNMRLFDFFRRKPVDTPKPVAAITLEQTSYDIAYFILPQVIFQSLERILKLCTKNPTAAGPFYYYMACQARGIEPDIEAGLKYKWHLGDFSNRKYLALEYPRPVPVDMGESDPITLLESGTKIVLAPFYSVILYDDDSVPQYYILGQAPIGGGTTVRAITAEGMNCNLGPGPEPELDLFFAAIRELQSAET